MTDFDLVLRGGHVVTDRSVEIADLGIRHGIITAVTPGLSGSAADEIDATALTVFPGGIDPHVHFDEPGRIEWEGLRAGTRALAAGGYTSYVDMPLNCVPPTIDERSLELKLAAAQRESLLDYAVWGGLVPGNRAELARLAKRGVAGFKAFLCDGGLADFPGVDDFTLYDGMQRIAELDSILLVHAENNAIVAGLAQRAIKAGAVGARDFVASRPPIAEVEAIARALLFAEETGCRLHVVHVSTVRGVQLVADAYARGVDVSCETCPHYLLFTDEDVEAAGVSLKSSPPVRSTREREGLWKLLDDGILGIVASDHSPGAPELRIGDDFFAVWGGVSGCQSTRQLLLAEGYARRGIDLPTIACATSTNVAERFRLPRKGRVAVGYDADLAVVDLGQEWTLAAAELHYRHRVSAYVGQRVRGRVVRTLVRGRTVFADGRFGEPGAGRLLVPPV
ncbi:MAG: allantoinase AllB [Solirubrobacteraceae bacterium]|nr:allantoinase AllB [Solirubrobacteraceae bacterium]